MGTKSKKLEADLKRALDDLEQLGDEIRVKLHLANMDAKDKWRNHLEPRLFEARKHAAEATESSAEAIDDVIQALREFRAHL